MPPTSFAKPFYIFFLVLPAGISFGFATVTLPYLLTNNGFSVAHAAGIVAIGASANLWRFLWGPVADLTLSLRKWFWIGIVACTSTLLLLCFVPFTVKGVVLLTVVVFVSQVAATLIMLPVGGFMAHRIEADKKGRAAGWFQAGNLGGLGLGGGVGLWLANHYSVAIAGVVLCGGSILCALVVQLIQDVERDKHKTIVVEVISMGKDIASMLRIPIVVFVIVMISMPIGSSATANLWSSVAVDWKTDADTVALVTGILSGLVSAIGCVLGGYIADKWGNWWAYLGSGTVYSLVLITMTAFSYTPIVYISGVLAYGFALGLINAAFSSVILYAIGKKSAATKYSLLSSLGNLPFVYMTAVDGWAHDLYGSKAMLLIEALLGLVFVAIALLALQQMKRRNWVLKSVTEL